MSGGGISLFRAGCALCQDYVNPDCVGKIMRRGLICIILIAMGRFLQVRRKKRMRVEIQSSSCPPAGTWSPILAEKEKNI